MRLDARPFGPQLRLLGALDELVGRHHLGDDEAGAQTLGDPPEGDIGDARQRREDRPAHSTRTGPMLKLPTPNF